MVELNDIDKRLIESHLDGELSIDEQAAFAQRCSTDAAFADEVRAYEQAVLSIKLANRSALKSKLQAHAAAQKEVKEEVKTVALPTQNPKRLRLVIVALAAAASLLIGAFVLGYLTPKTTDYDAAFQLAFTPTDSGGVEKNSTTQLTLLDSAYLAYDNKNWQNAANLLNAIPQPTPKTLFLKANAYLALNDVDKALPILKDLQNSPLFAERKEEVEWLMALCSVKKGDVTGVQKMAEMPNHAYFAKAKKVVDGLK
jgi:hypothetical protein